MQALVITARLAGRRLAPGLEVDLPVLPGELADEEVELAAVAAARAGDDGVALERPGVGGARGRERQRLVGRGVVADVQERRRVGALDRRPDVEELAAGLGAHHRDRGYGGFCQLRYLGYKGGIDEEERVFGRAYGPADTPADSSGRWATARHGSAPASPAPRAAPRRR